MSAEDGIFLSREILDQRIYRLIYAFDATNAVLYMLGDNINLSRYLAAVKGDNLSHVLEDLITENLYKIDSYKVVPIHLSEYFCIIDEAMKYLRLNTD